MTYKHLNEETSKIMKKSYEEKIDWINSDHFIYHDKANRILSELERVYNQSLPQFIDEPVDQNSVGIAGPSGTGKTMILKQFQKMHLKNPNSQISRFKVAYSLLRDAITGLGGLYSSILAGFGHPYGDYRIVRKKKVRIAVLEDSLLHLLINGEARVFIVDEFQHAQARESKIQRSFLNQLKRTMLHGKVPFIPVGTNDVIKVLAVDDQLPDRCPITEKTMLDYWEYDLDYKKFLEAYEDFLPFPEPSNLKSPDIANLIFNKVKYPHPNEVKPVLKPLYSEKKANKANLRNLVKYLKVIASIALYNNHDCITVDVINATAS